MGFILLFLFEFIFLFFFSRFLTRRLSFLPINLISFLFLPGVIIHELSHYLLASLLFVPVGEIEFMPEAKEGELKLGSVAIGETDPIRRFLIGIAPILGGLGVIFLIFQFVSLDVASLPLKILLFYALFTIGNTMFSSKKDMEGAVILLVVIFIFFLASFFAGFRPSASWLEGQFFLSMVNSVKQINLFLSFLIGLDVLVYLLIKILRR